MTAKHIYIIAEAGVNHNGSLIMAKQLIDAAVAAGADAVKFQTFKAASLVSQEAPKADYQLQTTDSEETQFAMLKKLELDETAHDELKKYCKQNRIDFLSTPFDTESLQLLVNKYNLPYIKIPSGEITNAPFLLEIARTGKPVILSTGMSTLGEVEDALQVLAFGYLNTPIKPGRQAFEEAYAAPEGQALLKAKVMLLHCTTEYPAPFEEVNLQAMDTLREAFGLPVGYSDHTPGYTVAIAAAARGAQLIEKHFTLDRNLPGPDHKASLEPQELAEMLQAIRIVEKALGQPLKTPTVSEVKNKAVARKSLVARQTIRQGEEFTEDNMTVKRPGTGLSPLYFWDLMGKRAAKAYVPDEQVTL
ncbi:MAG: N-acetylneuraminate synthase [Firmicutes bacterium]|nr:N-acetylneuraminate synthase [Bacillota bacterium]